jgi:hypothetical protein
MLRLLAPLAVVAVGAWALASDGAAENFAECDVAAAEPVEVPATPPILAAMPRYRAAADAVAEAAIPEADTESEPAPVVGEARTIPLRVRIVDADSGSLIRRAMWRVGADGMAPIEQQSDGEANVPVSMGDEVPRPDSALPWLIEAMPPTGDESSWVRWEEPPVSPLVSRYATRLTAVVLLHPEAEVFVSVARSDGDAEAPAAFAPSVTVGGRGVELRASEWTAGGFRLRGVPFVRGASWSLTASADYSDGSRSASAAGRFEGTPADGIRVALMFPPPSTFQGRGGHRSICCCGCGSRCRSFVENPRLPVGDVTLHVRRRDGRPAARAALRFEHDTTETIAGETAANDPRWQSRYDRADETGAITWRDIPAGHWLLSIVEDGLVPTVAVIDVAPRQLTTVTVTERSGSTIDLAVVDAEDKPVPFATVSLKQPSGADWLDVSDDDVQRLDDLTDVNGHRSLAHVESGDVEVRVSHGGRVAKATVHLGDRATERVRITLD